MTSRTAEKLDGSAISHRGMMLMGYQRTKQISRRAKIAWEAGDPSVLDAEILARRDEVFNGTVTEILEEYIPLRDALRGMAFTPETIVDIGCGQAINCALLFKDFGGKYTLIDIEETTNQYHFWNSEGSGYAALSDAEAFLLSNGLARSDLRAINPRKSPDDMAGVTGDLVLSSFSCGFHYPIGEYVDLMTATLDRGGLVMLDLRLRYLNRPDDALSRLLSVSKQTELLGLPKSKRILFKA